ncbi:MAG TPA: PTS sugar transporter subunit IIA, partial [Planctomycetes bacterium]|nr:PTS sugar transporter subunit IIA [Planctomycetota bacterium]
MALSSRIEAEEFRLSEIIRPEGIALDFHANSIPEVLGQIVALLIRARFISPSDAPLARTNFLDREEISSTAFKNGIAIPHARGPWAMGAVLAYYPDGLDWHTPDSLSVRLVVGIALPESGFRSYSLYATRLAEVLAFGRMTDKLAAASGPGDVINAIET